MEDPLMPATWEIRRKIVVSTLIFCAFCVLYLMFFGTDSRINETIVTACFALAGAVIGTYVFGVAWTDNKRIQFRSENHRSAQNGSRPPD